MQLLYNITMATPERFVRDPGQPVNAVDFAAYSRGTKEPLWEDRKILSYPVADLGVIPLLHVVKALPYGIIDFKTMVSGNGEVGGVKTSYDDWAPDGRQPQKDEKLGEQIEERLAYARLAHAALTPSIAIVANDYRERLELNGWDISVDIQGAKHQVTEATDLTDPNLDNAQWPHLDIRGLWYFASIGKSTRYWPGAFNVSLKDIEDDHPFYEQQIAAQQSPECSLPEDSIVCVDRHLLHAIPVFTPEEVPADRLMVSLSPNHSTPL